MHSYVVEVYHTGARRADTELVLRLGDGKTGRFAFYDEAGDAFVALECWDGRFMIHVSVTEPRKKQLSFILDRWTQFGITKISTA